MKGSGVSGAAGAAKNTLCTGTIAPAAAVVSADTSTAVAPASARGPSLRRLSLLRDCMSPLSLHASLLRAMGISPRLSYEIEKRPFYVTRDGEGKPILDLFA